MLFVVPPAQGVRLALGFVEGFRVWVFLEWLGGFLDWSRGFCDHVGCRVSCRRLIF